MKNRYLLFTFLYRNCKLIKRNTKINLGNHLLTIFLLSGIQLVLLVYSCADSVVRRSEETCEGGRARSHSWEPQLSGLFQKLLVLSSAVLFFWVFWASGLG
ncbi:hypothetical protein ES288_A13G215000v1 [Gossypium darwinii]|uniref:Uncharacterized protein n=1 Tax=Gossypium darwinii TaxID=34276 RepID=A0A5D2E2L7_GOSDA|nr:hypothetical protein ES288_A13G215000v1 [Gossypium darwinii]